MFDYVRCRYPLPHHQNAEFQTKDVARIVDPGDLIDGLLDRYVITKTGRLRRQLHKRKAVKTGRRFPSVVLKSIKSWWVDVPDAHGDVLIYTTDDTPGKRQRRWIEFRIRFTNGRVQEVEDRSRSSLAVRKRARTNRPRRAKSTSSRAAPVAVADVDDPFNLRRRGRHSPCPLAQRRYASIYSHPVGGGSGSGSSSIGPAAHGLDGIPRPTDRHPSGPLS